jgi:hypothetical protein
MGRAALKLAFVPAQLPCPLPMRLNLRYLSRCKCSRSDLQLVGITCLWLAAKYEEVHPPPASELVSMTESTYSVKQVLAMECKVLAALEFSMGAPTPEHFLDCFALEVRTGPRVVLLPPPSWRLARGGPLPAWALRAQDHAMHACIHRGNQLDKPP